MEKITEESVSMKQFETAKDFLDLLNKVEGDYSAINDELRLLEDETQDLLHEMELANLNCRDGYKLYKKMQEVRQRRRTLKCRLEMLEPILRFAETGTGRSARNDIAIMVSKMRKTSEYHANATYRPRVRDDLTIAKKEQPSMAASN